MYDERDDAPYFTVTCACGIEWRNDEDCPTCRMSSLSYTSGDTRRWNEWVDYPERSE